MEVANTLAYYDMVTIFVAKKFCFKGSWAITLKNYLEDLILDE
jgi:hypothetical protein